MSIIERYETDREFSFSDCKLQRRLDNNYCMHRTTMTSSSWKEMQFPQGRILDINRCENVNLKHFKTTKHLILQTSKPWLSIKWEYFLLKSDKKKTNNFISLLNDQRFTVILLMMAKFFYRWFCDESKSDMEMALKIPHTIEKYLHSPKQYSTLTFWKSK